MDVKYKKADEREWSTIAINGFDVEMLWDSGASISVMSEECWKMIGSPILIDSRIRLSGVFSKEDEKPLGSVKLIAEWNKKRRELNVIIVKKILPSFIGGVDTMKQFGMELKEINNIDAALVKNRFTDADRLKFALEIFKCEKKSKFGRIISEFSSIFMASRFDLGYTKVISHEITTAGPPILQNPRRQPMHLENKIEELIQNLLESGVVRRCQSPWNSPLVIVGKPDGSIRMCLDFRQLNAVTEKYSFPMPDMQLLLDCLSKSKIFSSIDLGQAYYQVELHENSQIKTAFSTKEGQFCFNRLPFGLSTAPATFQKLMHQILEGLIFKGVVVYLDDILIYAQNQEEHDKLLYDVFTRIRDTGLRVNPEKCSFYKKELNFIGHTVSEKGVKTNKKKIAEIENASEPKSVTQLRSFLGLTNYYRRFIKNYSIIAAPLYAATTGSEKQVMWNEACKNSFINLKKALCEAPVLEYPRSDRLFIIDTDASFGAIGAVLSQIREDGTEGVIAYGSRHLTTHEMGYCVTRKELLALHEFIVYFRQYLYGKKFIARTDHKALTFMNTTKKPISPQFQTWMANLSEYNFDLQYRKGEDHGNADGMSRLNYTMCAQCQTEHNDAKETKCRTRYINSLQGSSNMIEIIRRKQSEDKIIAEIKDHLNGSVAHLSFETISSRIFKFLEKLQVQDDLLMIETDGIIATVVPEEYVETLINHFHIELCHLGIKKTLFYLKDFFFWPSMNQRITECINKCKICASRKIDQGRTKEILLPRIGERFLEQIVVDIAYMDTKRSEKKYMVVIIDRFSKLVSLSSTNSQDESTILNVILNNWIYKFGRPESILTDRGRIFEGSMFRDWMSKFGIKQEFSSPYQHQSNGLAERVIRTVRDMLATSLTGAGLENNWQDLLPRIEFSLNATIQNSTNFSPFEIVYGRKVNLFSRLGHIDQGRDEIASKTKTNLQKAATTMHNRDLDKRGSRIFKVGERVLVRMEPHRRKKDGSQYEGPFQIVKFLSPRQVELQYPTSRKTRRIEWLKRCKENEEGESDVII